MEFEVKATFPVKRKQLYKAWLSSKKHSAMTGGEAIVSKKIGASFSAWDGYIQGINLILEPKKRIVQNWRTTEFNENEAGSQIEILFKKAENGTEVTIIHTNLPTHGEQYKQGWIDHYFAPMQEYFSS